MTTSTPFEALQPLDEHNQRLQAHVHPSDYTNPRPAEKYNLVVIGAGTAGLVSAAVAAGLGAKVALVERALMGGDCLNVGCVPSKGIIGAARAMAAVRRAEHFGVRVPDGTSMDFSVAMERMRRLRSNISAHDSVRRFSDLGVDVFLGQATFADAETVDVNGSKLRFSKAVICTGARAAAPPIQGLDSVPYLTNETLFSLTALPRRFGVIGAGPVGMEMAQSFAQFGSEVTLMTSQRGCLPNEDREAAELVQRALERDGVQIVTGGRALEVAASPDGGIRLKGSFAEGVDHRDVDQLLVAVGRAPNVEGLGLEAAGIEYSAKGVRIDDTFHTTNRRVFAAGDICSPYKFTHAADFMARAVVRNALFKGRAKHSDLLIPWSTYTTPELAHIGLTPQEAEKQGVELDTFTQAMSGVDRAILEGETEGFVRVHVKKGSDQIVGATAASAHAGDLIGAVSLAMSQGIGLGKIANAIHPYPTQAEALRKVGDLYNRTKLTPFVAKMFRKWLQWSR